MRKLFILSTAAFMALSLPALAEHGDSEHSRHKGKMFESMDLNGDALVSKEEFMQAHEKKFTEIDANADGQITEEEIKARKAAWKAEHGKDKAAPEVEEAPAPAE
ncbi:MAG: hypothetical protein K9G62_04705 [Alphaproteobacteria bacterium]|nr:hypothetical protein [Alphaproteobacteria bacterium]